MTASLIKWAGGKRQLISDLQRLLPENFNTYFEPFIGGGAMFFALRASGKIKKAIISDVNHDLVNLYRIVKESPHALFEELNDLRYGNNAGDYYDARKVFNSFGKHELPEKKAALFIYLNRHCYNGLFRVNSRGEFNVPFGKYKNPGIPGMDKLIEVSRALTDTEILNSDFDTVLENVSSGDFVYLDPPYAPVNATSSFTDYNSGGFGLVEQKRLASTFYRLSQVGAYVMLSNSATPEILQLYDGFPKEIVGARRVINSNAHRRGVIKEVVVTNYRAAEVNIK